MKFFISNNEYYVNFENLSQASMDNIMNAGSQLQFVLKKKDPSIWWCRLTSQPQKQNWIHVSNQWNLT